MNNQLIIEMATISNAVDVLLASEGISAGQVTSIEKGRSLVKRGGDLECMYLMEALALALLTEISTKS